MTKQNRKYYEELKNKGIFDDEQMKQIRLGLKDGLTPEQISIYAKPEFSNSQMYQIREGLKMV